MWATEKILFTILMCTNLTKLTKYTAKISCQELGIFYLRKIAKVIEYWTNNEIVILVYTSLWLSPQLALSNELYSALNLESSSF